MTAHRIETPFRAHTKLLCVFHGSVDLSRVEQMANESEGTVVGVVWVDWLLRRSIPSDLCRSDYETTTCLLLGSETRMKQ